MIMNNNNIQIYNLIHSQIKDNQLNKYFLINNNQNLLSNYHKNNFNNNIINKLQM